MGWQQLLDIQRDIAADRREQLATPPTACPNDGEPLEQGPHGQLHCPADGWTWPS